jgi:hypothetical protein
MPEIGSKAKIILKLKFWSNWTLMSTLKNRECELEKGNWGLDSQIVRCKWLVLKLQVRVQNSTASSCIYHMDLWSETMSEFLVLRQSSWENLICDRRLETSNHSLFMNPRAVEEQTEKKLQSVNRKVPAHISTDHMVIWWHLKNQIQSGKLQTHLGPLILFALIVKGSNDRRTTVKREVKPAQFARLKK